MEQLETAASEQASPENEAQAEAAQKKLETDVKKAIKAKDDSELLTLAESNPNVAGALLRANGKAVALAPKKSQHIEKEPLTTEDEPDAMESESEAGETSTESESRESESRESEPDLWGHCYNGVHSQTNYNTTLGTVAWLYTAMPAWCGIPNVEITYNASPQFASWDWGPYCLTSKNTLWGWDVYPRWQHGGNWAEVGVSYAFGCLGVRGFHATLRIAANGYWDNYDDFGF